MCKWLIPSLGNSTFDDFPEVSANIAWPSTRHWALDQLRHAIDLILVGDDVTWPWFGTL